MPPLEELELRIGILNIKYFIRMVSVNTFVIDIMF